MKRLFPAAVAFAALCISLHAASAQVQGQWTSVATLQSARQGGVQVEFATGAVLVAGGVDGGGMILSSTEIFKLGAAAWAPAGVMAAARELFPAVRLANGKVLVSGGLGTGGAVLGAAELFDPATGAWSPAGALSTPRFGHTATLLTNGKVLVAGGCVSDPCAAAAAVSELYDPSTNAWSTTGSLNTPRYSHVAVRLKNGKVLAIGGSTGSPTNSVELYNPTTGVWSPAASTNTPRYNSAATLLADGRVLATGGVITRFPLNSAELYDPVANTWTLTGSMTTGRYAHSASLLGDGTVLVAGGEGQSISCGKACTSYIPTARAEIYDEAKGGFAAVPDMSRARAYQTATLVGGGRALVAGGVGVTSICCIVLGNAEYYTPLTLTISPASLSFGLLQIGLTSGAKTVMVNNVSSHSVTFSSIAASGDFKETSACPATLDAGQTCSVSVSFAPTAAGLRIGALTFKDDSPGSPSQTVALSGTGEALALGFSASWLKFGSVAVGSSASAMATLVNDGAGPISPTGISLSPKGAFKQTDNCPTSLAEQQSCAFQIVFTPPDVFSYGATLSVANSAGAAAKLMMSGSGVDGATARR